MEKGKAIGLAEGLAKGKEKERIAFAQKCLQKGMSVEDIAELTGLSMDSIRSLLIS
jgi:predicted transposase/invertase (TIGR01784 family)